MALVIITSQSHLVLSIQGLCIATQELIVLLIVFFAIYSWFETTVLTVAFYVVKWLCLYTVQCNC